MLFNKVKFSYLPTSSIKFYYINFNKHYILKENSFLWKTVEK